MDKQFTPPPQATGSNRSMLLWVAVVGLVLAIGGVGFVYWHFIWKHKTKIEGGETTALFPGLPELNESRAHVTKANQLWAGGKKTEAAPHARLALSAAQKAVDNDKAAPTIRMAGRVVVGQSHRILGETEQAQRILEAVLKDAAAANEAGVAVDALIEWAYAVAPTGRVDEAINRLREAERPVEQTSRGHEFRLAQARVYEISDRPGPAVQVYNRIVDRFPGREKEWKHRAEFLLAQLNQKIGSSPTTKAAAKTVIAEATISGAARWTRDAGPYLVEKKLVVPAGAILTIDPGVKVHFAEGAGLVINGALKAEGEAAAVIELLPSADRLAGYSWLGIEIAADGSQPASSLTHCRISAAVVGIAIRGCSPKLKKCTVERTGSAGVRITAAAETAADPTIEETVFTANAGSGIELRGKAVRGSIVGCTVEKTQGAGVLVEEAAAPRIAGTVVRDGLGDGVVFARNGAGQVGEKTSVVGNRGHGIRMDYRCTPTIDVVTVSKNGGEGIYVYDSEPKIENTLIDANTGAGVLFAYTAAGRLAGCTITANGKAGIVFENAPGKPTITGNRIGGSPAGVLIRDGVDLAISGNDLSGNKPFAVQNDTGNVLDAGGNFWGPVVEAEIKKLIKGPAKIDGFKTTAGL